MKEHFQTHFMRPALCTANHVQLCDTVACQDPTSMGFSRQEYRSGLLCPPARDLPDPGIEPASLTFPALAGGLLTTSATWEAQHYYPDTKTRHHKDRKQEANNCDEYRCKNPQHNISKPNPVRH